MTDNNKIVYRIDTFKLPKVRKTPEGYIEGEVVASRAGVFKYLNADGSIRYELRHPDDIFKKDSLDTLKMIPITDDHPQEFVNAANANKLQKGFTGESYRIDDNKNIIVKLKITDKDLIDKIISGKKPELSLGYSVLLKREDGEYEGIKYSYRQTELEYNHLAAVKYARAGRNARFRFDSQENVAECNYIEEDKMSDETKELKHTDKDIELKESRIDALTNENLLLKQRIEVKDSQIKSMEDALANIKKERDELKSMNIDAVVQDRANKRLAIFVRAASKMGDDISAYMNHSDRQVMEITLKHMASKKGINLDFSGKSDDYVMGVFDRETDGVSINSNNKDSKKLLKLVSDAQGLNEYEETVADKAMSILTKKGGK